METKTVWLENLVLFNKCVQASGGIMDIISSYTDLEGDVAARVSFDKLDRRQELEYEFRRFKKGDKNRFNGGDVDVEVSVGLNSFVVLLDLLANTR